MYLLKQSSLYTEVQLTITRIDNKNVLIKKQNRKYGYIHERSSCFHKKTLRYTCKPYAVFSEPHISLSLSLCVNILMQPRKVPVLLRFRLLYDCLNINLGIISLTPMCKLRRQNHVGKENTCFAYAVLSIYL